MCVLSSDTSWDDVGIKRSLHYRNLFADGELMENILMMMETGCCQSLWELWKCEFDKIFLEYWIVICIHKILSKYDLIMDQFRTFKFPSQKTSWLCEAKGMLN